MLERVFEYVESKRRECFCAEKEYKGVDVTPGNLSDFKRIVKFSEHGQPTIPKEAGRERRWSSRNTERGRTEMEGRPVPF